MTEGIIITFFTALLGALGFFAVKWMNELEDKVLELHKQVNDLKVRADKMDYDCVRREFCDDRYTAVKKTNDRLYSRIEFIQKEANSPKRLHTVTGTSMQSGVAKNDSK